MPEALSFLPQAPVRESSILLVPQGACLMVWYRCACVRVRMSHVCDCVLLCASRIIHWCDCECMSRVCQCVFLCASDHALPDGEDGTGVLVCV